MLLAGHPSLRGHPSLQELSQAHTSTGEAHCQQQLLCSMPQLRVLNLSRVEKELLGALLEEASGSAQQLQELRLDVARECWTSAAAGTCRRTWTSRRCSS